MFEIINTFGTRIKVYAVELSLKTGDTIFLIWDEGKWKWVYADAYEPITN